MNDARSVPATDLEQAPGPVGAFGCGLGMGVADAVPGVSGGTIALILGIYETLISSIAATLDGLRRPWNPEARRGLLRALRFLLPLGIGAVIALVTAIRLLVGSKPPLEGLDAAETLRVLAAAEGLLINPQTAPVVFAFFFGLVLASINEPWRHKRSSRGVDWVLAAIGAAASASLALSPVSGAEPGPLLLLSAGALAISVMLLPGISGSLALLVIGMYQPVAAAAHDRDLVTLGWFLGGMLVGVSVFIPLLRLVLARAHDRTMALLSGLMAGSLVALYPWKVHYFPEAMGILGPMQPIAPHGSWWWPVLAAVAGAVLVMGVGHWARRRSDRL
jgi:putative membrane protein